MLVDMTDNNYRLYVGSKIRTTHESFDDAKSEADKHISKKLELRIESLTGNSATDFWAYIYEVNEWVRS